MSSQLRIAMTHVDLPNEARGGVAFQVHYLANALVDRGHDVTLFTLSPACPDGRYRVHTYSRPYRARSYAPYLFAMNLARTDFSGFDVLHTHGDNFLLWGRHPQLRTFYGSAIDEAQAATTLRCRLSQRVTAKLEAVGARVADLSTGISAATRARIPQIATLVPCGVDTDHFRPGPKAERPVVLFVGTVEGRKRGRFLADVFLREVKPRHPDAELWMVTEQAVAGDGIRHLGRVTINEIARLHRLYQRAWVFCLPSMYEGFGIPYIEAMASGTPVVASPNPGAREVLADGRFGVLASDDQLGTALNTLLEDRGRREALAARGLVRAREFNWEQVTRQYEILYARLTGREV